MTYNFIISRSRIAQLFIASLTTVSVSSCGQVLLYYIPQQLSIQSAPEDFDRGLDDFNGASSGSQTLSSGQLQLKAIIRNNKLDIGNLQVKVTLRHGESNFETSLTISAEQLNNNDVPPLADLPIGESTLLLELVDDKGEVLVDTQSSINITPSSETSTLFVLSDDPAANNGGGGFALSIGAETVDSQSSPAGNSSPISSSINTGGSIGDAPPPDPKTLPQNLRSVSIKKDSITIGWDAPEVGAKGYNIYLDGKLSKENHQLSSFGIFNLKAKTEYKIEVAAIDDSGQEMARTTLTETTTSGSSSSSGGGGGGGGGGSSSGGGGGAPATNNPPVIQSLVASKTNLSGVGLPVRLTATATDEAALPATAYTWSCDECADGGASFNQTNGNSVIWTAPNTPGTYTMRVRVSDGVNAPVEQTQTITVTSSTADVIFQGDQA